MELSEISIIHTNTKSVWQVAHYLALDLANAGYVLIDSLALFGFLENSRRMNNQIKLNTYLSKSVLKVGGWRLCSLAN